MFFFTKKRKFLFHVALIVSVFLATASSSQASVWGVNEANNWAITQYKSIMEKLQQALLAAAKKAALKVLNTQVSVAITGGSDGVKFITNWGTYLETDPQKKTDAFMNDFFAMTTSGRSSSNYHSVANSSTSGSAAQALLPRSQQSWLVREGIVSSVSASSGGSGYTTSASENSNYDKYLEGVGKAATISQKTPKVDIWKYAPDPKTIFKNGDYGGLSQFTTGINNPFAYASKAQEVYQEKLLQEKDIAKTQAVAYQGFKAAVSSDGVSVKTPGITIGQLVEKAQGINFDTIPNAQDVAGVIVATAGAAIDSAVNGIADYAGQVADEAVNYAVSAAEEYIDQGGNIAANAIEDGVDSGLGYLNGSASVSSNGQSGYSVSGGALASINWDTSSRGTTTSSSSTSTKSSSGASTASGASAWGSLGDESFSITDTSTSTSSSSSSSSSSQNTSSSASADTCTWQDYENGAKCIPGL